MENLETAETEDGLKESGECRLNVAGVLRILGVSRSGYNNWKKRLPSKRELRKNALKERILEIYNKSHQNYGAPKITECLKRLSPNEFEEKYHKELRKMKLIAG
ncbi:MAG: hypothetical protein HDT39_02505 [Lachnospiraceae bacterium]|nr:hypothetical protein [Lachnospiraceae bacterium]